MESKPESTNEVFYTLGDIAKMLGFDSYELDRRMYGFPSIAPLARVGRICIYGPAELEKIIARVRPQNRPSTPAPDLGAAADPSAFSFR